MKLTTREGIEVIEGLEALRRHPSPYVGGRDAAEQLDNLVVHTADALLHPEGCPGATTVTTSLLADGWIHIRDDGPGLSIDPVGDPPRPRFDELMTTISHQGARDRAAGGQLWMWGSILNAMSARLYVRTFREGYWYRAVFSRGLYVSVLRRTDIDVMGCGTRLLFMPDSEVFEGATLVGSRLQRALESVELAAGEHLVFEDRSDTQPEWL